MSGIEHGVDGDEIWFAFEAPTRPLSENESRTIHWATRRNRLKPWKEIVLEAWYAMKDDPEVVAKVGDPGLVLVELPFDRTDKQWATDRRDPHNYVSTMCKVIIDVLTDKATGSVKRGDKVIETRLWPDDTAEWVKVIEPELVRGKRAKVTIKPWDQTDG